MMIEILWDMLPFLLVMGFLILGFSGAFYILFTPDMTQEGRGQLPSAFTNFQSSLLSTFLMILGSFDINVFKESTPHSDMAIFMFCLYQVLGMIVLLNLLIAIMGDTFDRVRDREALHFWKGRCVKSYNHLFSTKYQCCNRHLVGSATVHASCVAMLPTVITGG